jgi:hypothetical protein
LSCFLPAEPSLLKKENEAALASADEEGKDLYRGEFGENNTESANDASYDPEKEAPQGLDEEAAAEKVE